jgi:hypothetical protein
MISKVSPLSAAFWRRALSLLIPAWWIRCSWFAMDDKEYNEATRYFYHTLSNQKCIIRVMCQLTRFLNAIGSLPYKVMISSSLLHQVCAHLPHWEYIVLIFKLEWIIKIRFRELMRCMNLSQCLWITNTNHAGTLNRDKFSMSFLVKRQLFSLLCFLTNTHEWAIFTVGLLHVTDLLASGWFDKVDQTSQWCMPWSWNLAQWRKPLVFHIL